MQNISCYQSPLGTVQLTSDEIGLTALRFASQSDAAGNDSLAIAAAKRWLDIYFAGGIPDFTPPLHPIGTPFQQAVWARLAKISYGASTTYGALAKAISPTMSAQAVGGAVGKNPIAVILPCHRVLGINHKLTGYAYGLERKAALLSLENIPFTP